MRRAEHHPAGRAPENTFLPALLQTTWRSLPTETAAAINDGESHSTDFCGYLVLRSETSFTTGVTGEDASGIASELSQAVDCPLGRVNEGRSEHGR
jgi:hypothetical protein